MQSIDDTLDPELINVREEFALRFAKMIFYQLEVIMSEIPTYAMCLTLQKLGYKGPFDESKFEQFITKNRISEAEFKRNYQIIMDRLMNTPIVRAYMYQGTDQTNETKIT